MIDYETRCRIRHMHQKEGLNFQQIALALGLDPETASKYARAENFVARRPGRPRAMEDAIACEAYGSQYIENILHQRAQPAPQPGPLHLTRRSDLLDIELSTADLSLYEKPAHP